MKKRAFFFLTSFSALLVFLFSSFSQYEKSDPTMLCPCHSEMSYQDCCMTYHDGGFPENALLLMRSRYSAYALMRSDYIIRTTHVENPMYTIDFVQWKESIQNRYQNVQFEDLKILEFASGEEKAFVTFKAILKRGEENVSFTEKSTFLKVGDLWLYKEGIKVYEN